MAENSREPAGLRAAGTASGTVSGVMTDLAMVAERLPAGRGESLADLLDRLAMELKEAAQMLRKEAGI